MSNGKPSVSFVLPEQHEQAAVALGKAFADDPVMWAILPQPTNITERPPILTRVFSTLMQAHRRQGLPVFGVVDSGKVVGAAIVEGSQRPGLIELLTSSWSVFPRMFGILGACGAMTGVRIMDELGRNHPAEGHIYLQILGVDPDFQKRHYGVALLDHLNAMVWPRPEVAGVYLETATPANVPYYQRAGYEVVGELMPAGVKIWRMFQRKRAPQ